MKMSDAFKLPLEVGNVEPEAVFDSDKNYVVEFANEEMSFCAAHAINHADALADALADLILACYESGHNILACTYAEDALAAYRGVK